MTDQVPDRPSPARLAILISGRGSNMLSIADACSSGELHASIEMVISNRPHAAGLIAAAERGLKTTVIDHQQFSDRLQFDRALHAALTDVQPDWIVLAGFMRILGTELVNGWHGRIVNIHPSLLPKYPGLHTHARALEAGDTEAGASVHIVTPDLDAGSIVAQARIPVNGDDTAETLAARVLLQEHDLYVRALQICLANSY